MIYDKTVRVRQQTGNRNATFLLKMISEKEIHVQQDMYLCFIYSLKAFVKLRHQDLLELLRNTDIFGKDIRRVNNLS